MLIGSCHRNTQGDLSGSQHERGLTFPADSRKIETFVGDGFDNGTKHESVTGLRETVPRTSLLASQPRIKSRDRAKRRQAATTRWPQ